MENKKTVEEQVAELTDEQKETVLKVAKHGGIAIICASLPFILVSLIGCIIMITDFDRVTDEFIGGFYIFIFLGIAAILAILAFIKIKFPFYSDKKAKYLKNQKKEQK